MESHHLAMFSSYWSSVGGEKIYLICNMTSQKYMIEGRSNFMTGSSSWYVATLPSLVVIGIVRVEM